MQNTVVQLNEKLKDLSAKEVIAFFLETHKGEVAFSSSFGAEDQVVTDMIMNIDNNAKIFTLDTGRLPYETYNLMHETNLRYETKVDVYFPNEKDIKELYQNQGINGFYDSVEHRKNCCYVRKILPLKRALKGLKVWITGLRAEQSITREYLKLLEWDEGNQVIKVNPLLSWKQEDVWTYIKVYKLPYNKLHDVGYPSIGCAPCTRAVEKGEDLRSGRWWWENPEHKECGLHLKQFSD